MNRLVLCVEGRGDVDVAPILVSRVLDTLPPELQGTLFLDSKPVEVGGAHQLTGKKQGDWRNYLEIAKKRPKLGAVLLLVDGDTTDKVKIEGQVFCAARVGQLLADRARQTGAGTLYSVGVVILRQEFESLLIASYTSLPGSRPEIAPPEAPEEAPRGAKEWLRKNLTGGYKETQHQAPLTRALDLERVRAANLRSFRRLEKAVQELAVAAHSGTHVSTPVVPEPPVDT